MRSKKINRHLYCQTEFHGKSEKNNLFSPRELSFLPNNVFKKISIFSDFTLFLVPDLNPKRGPHSYSCRIDKFLNTTHLSFLASLGEKLNI